MRHPRRRRRRCGSRSRAWTSIQATPGEISEFFGIAIAASGDTLVVGATGADRPGLPDAGAVYVFNRNAAGAWVQHARLVPSDTAPSAGDSFGRAVAIEDDTLVIGAPFSGQIIGVPQSGAVYVFTRNPSTGVWSQQQKIVVSDAAIADFFGSAVALSGNTLMASSPSDDNGTVDAGAVYVFTRIGSVWFEDSKLIPDPPTQFDFFGGKLALDGNIAVISSNATTRDGLYVYEYSGATGFSLSTRIQVGTNIGLSVALDDMRLAVGVPVDDQGAPDAGAVFVYERIAAGSWVPTAVLLASNPSTSARLGTNVLVHGDTVLASKNSAQAPGEAYVFSRNSSGTWTEDARLLPLNPVPEERFGASLAIAGESALVGAPGPTRCPATGCIKGSVYEYVVLVPGDETPPVVTVPISFVANAQSASGAFVSFAASAVDDVDGPITPSCTPASGSLFPIATTTVSCTATDAAGNSASASFEIIVSDNTAPDAQCTNVVLECTGPQTPVTTSCTATDAVDASPTVSSSALASYPVGFHFYNCIADDDAGNHELEQCSAYVQDTTPPTCIPPETGYVSCTSPGGVSRGQAFVAMHINQIESDDLCSPSGIMIEGPLFLPAGCDEGYTSTITYRVSDSHDNEATCTTDIVVTDNGGVLVHCPAPAQLECNITGGVDASDGNIASWLAEAEAFDECNEVALTNSSPPFYGLGETRVFFTGEDACGHTSVCPGLMTVVDTTPPEVACQDVVVECTGALTAAAPSCSALDVCAAAPALTSDVDPAGYPLGAHAYTCEAADGHGNGAAASCQITVVDTTAPVLAGLVTTTAPVQIGTVIQASAHFTDACGPHSGVIAWGDGTTSAAAIAEGAGQGDASASHAYATPGVYTLTLTLSDASGNTSSTSFQYVVAFDPNGGFVTGAGAIESPAGAYAPDPSLVGRAQFGFQARYTPGATTPTGSTQFRFRAADLEFNATSYEWLVVAGTRAIYRGAGTLNGIPGYSFQLTAGDGGHGGDDTFRMKISSAGQGVVYDNQRGAPDDAPATQVTAGGNIIVNTH